MLFYTLLRKGNSLAYVTCPHGIGRFWQGKEKKGARYCKKRKSLKKNCRYCTHIKRKKHVRRLSDNVVLRTNVSLDKRIDMY